MCFKIGGFSPSYFPGSLASTALVPKTQNWGQMCVNIEKTWLALLFSPSPDINARRKLQHWGQPLLTFLYYFCPLLPCRFFMRSVHIFVLCFQVLTCEGNTFLSRYICLWKHCILILYEHAAFFISILII